MNRIERDNDLTGLMLAALRGWQAGIFTSDIGIIDSFDASKQTCTVQLATQQKIRNQDGVENWVTLPLLVDVPVHFPNGGGFTLTFPVAKGDECLVVFAQRCIDYWYESGGVQRQAELRMHDISDGFAFVGFRSLPRMLFPHASVSAAQLRSDDGLTFVEVADGSITLKAPTSVTIDTPMTTITGDLIVQGKATITKLLTYLGGLLGGGGSGSSITGNLTHTSGALTSNGIQLDTHKHSDPQGGTTGGPV